MEERKRRPGSASAVLLIAIILAAGASFGGWRGWRRHVVERNERNASACLKMIAVANVDFRSNDRDDNGVNDFWTGDVASLCTLPVSATRTGFHELQLIERALADADGARPDARPLHGYLFRAMDLDEEGKPYRQNTGAKPGVKPERNASKFAYCAYPAAYGRTGRRTFIVNEYHALYGIDIEGRPVLAWPSDDELKRSYSIPD